MNDWLHTIHPQTVALLNHLWVGDGVFRYSYSGDLPHAQSLLAPSIFALKLYALLGLPADDRLRQTIARVHTYQTTNDSFIDPVIIKKRRWRAAVSQLKHGHLPLRLDEPYIRAETRQAYSALLVHDALPPLTSVPVPIDPAGIHSFLVEQDWSKPWHAGSHVSHLLFFLSLAKHTGILTQAACQEATDTVLTYLHSIEQSDGSWYLSNPSPSQRINGAMKIITGLLYTPQHSQHPQRLIDLCLSHPAQADRDACHQINQLLVVRYASQWTQYTYRSQEIESYCQQLLNDWQRYYHQDLGGFSFYPSRANQRYYGAAVTAGRNEPDIHATTLFLWGLSLMTPLIPEPALVSFHEIRS
jgi:hypothetical protein